MQFLAEPLLFAVADGENFALKPFAPLNFIFQFGIGTSQRLGPLHDAPFQKVFRFLQCRFDFFPFGNVDNDRHG